jgi:hypothetical protein
MQIWLHGERLIGMRCKEDLAWPAKEAGLPSQEPTMGHVMFRNAATLLEEHWHYPGLAFLLDDPVFTQKLANDVVVYRA